MTTPQNAPAGKHHAPTDEVGDAERAEHSEHAQNVEKATNGQNGVPLVRLVDVGKRYGAVIALSDINMKVGAREVTCVLGDNGAGKSTLIKIIAGLHQPSSGRYEVEVALIDPAGSDDIPAQPKTWTFFVRQHT